MRARKDIRTAVPLIPVRAPDGRTLIQTGYMVELRDTAERAGAQARVKLVADHARLLREIDHLAAAVVRYDELGRHDTIHHWRLRRSVETWRRAVGAAAQQHDSTVAGLNQMLAVYWALLEQEHPELRGRGAGPHPERVVLCGDDRWDRPLDLLTNRNIPGRADHRLTVLDRAIQIVLGAPR